MRHLHPLSSLLELSIDQSNQKPKGQAALLLSLYRWATGDTDQERGAEWTWRDNKRYSVHSHDPGMINNYYLSLPLPSGWSHIASRILSWCHPSYFFFYFILSQITYSIWLVLIFPCRKSLSCYIAFKCNAHSPSLFMWLLSLKQIENSGISKRSYLAFWYKNIDADKTCKIPI